MRYRSRSCPPGPVWTCLRLALLGSVLALPAWADVTISNSPTANMTCAGGQCAPTAADAVLNTTDLAAMLQAGNVRVTSTGAGIEAKDVVVAAPLGWTVTSTLEIDAYRSISVNKPVMVTGAGGVVLITDNGGSGGTLMFGLKGRLAFKNLASPLRIGPTTFTLVGSVMSLANAVAANAAGAYALADDYDASNDGVYVAAPVSTTLTGQFSGLGNTITKLSIDDQSGDSVVGLFTELANGGSISGIRLRKASVKSNTPTNVGSLVGHSEGTISNSSSNGSVTLIKSLPGQSGMAGGLVGSVSGGTIETSHADVAVNGGRANGASLGGLTSIVISGTVLRSSASGAVSGQNAVAGGLVALFQSSAMSTSFATGNVTGGPKSYSGGLVAASSGVISNCYATGIVSAGQAADVGGLIGYNQGKVTSSYSTGTVGETVSVTGGLVGRNDGTATRSYWDTTTSGTDTGVGSGSRSGIMGSTTTELQSGLPAGFNNEVWGERSTVVSGLPYLLNNQPGSP